MGKMDNTKSHQVVEVRREAVAPCISCPLCHKLFRDATTITECLHTFCWKCISTKLSEEGMHCCPVCHIHLGCAPLEKLRRDHHLQDVRAEIFSRERIKVKATEVVTHVSQLAKRKEISLSSLAVGTQDSHVKYDEQNPYEKEGLLPKNKNKEQRKKTKVEKEKNCSNLTPPETERLKAQNVGNFKVPPPIVLVAAGTKFDRKENKLEGDGLPLPLPPISAGYMRINDSEEEELSHSDTLALEDSLRLQPSHAGTMLSDAQLSQVHEIIAAETLKNKLKSVADNVERIEADAQKTLNNHAHKTQSEIESLNNRVAELERKLTFAEEKLKEDFQSAVAAQKKELLKELSSKMDRKIIKEVKKQVSSFLTNLKLPSADQFKKIIRFADDYDAFSKTTANNVRDMHRQLTTSMETKSYDAREKMKALGHLTISKVVAAPLPEEEEKKAYDLDLVTMAYESGATPDEIVDPTYMSQFAAKVHAENKYASWKAEELKRINKAKAREAAMTDEERMERERYRRLRSHKQFKNRENNFVHEDKWVPAHMNDTWESLKLEFIEDFYYLRKYGKTDADEAFISFMDEYKEEYPSSAKVIMKAAAEKGITLKAPPKKTFKPPTIAEYDAVDRCKILSEANVVACNLGLENHQKITAGIFAKYGIEYG